MRDKEQRMHKRVVVHATLDITLLALAALVVIFVLGARSAQAAITHPYTGSSVGPGGVGSGSFGNVQGVAVEQSSGDVLVYDDDAGGRVYKFDAAGEPVDFSGTGTNFIEGVGGAGVGEEEIAVDDSSGPDAGDIYVANNTGVRIYAASGAPLGELSGGEMCGVAVDPNGNVYVGSYPNVVRRYAPRANPVTNADETGAMGGLNSVCNIAVDAAGDVYAAAFGGGVQKYEAMQFGSLSASGTAVDAQGRTLAVDSAANRVFIDEANGISEYDGAIEPPKLQGSTGASGEGVLADSFGVAEDHKSGKLYAADHDRVKIFGPGVVVAGVSTEGVTGLGATQATLHGSVEPAGTEVEDCVFEYGAEAGPLSQSAPCEPATPYTGSASVAVTAHLTGLDAGTSYRYRIVASGVSGTEVGAEKSFTTAGPRISGEEVRESGLGSNTAVASAVIDPSGEATKYFVEYGTTTAYGSTTTPVEIQAGEPVPVTVHIGGLHQDTTYHLRLVAASATATDDGPDVTFTTDSIVTNESFAEVGAYSAALSAEVDPGGETTTYQVEYGTSTAYGSSTPPVSLGAGEAPVAVTSKLTGLQPGAIYHFRFVALKAGETGFGPDVVFTAHVLVAPGLPDGRGYEKVSPNDNAGSNVYQDIPSSLSVEGGSTEYPFVVSPEGNAVSYLAGPPEHGGYGVEGGDAGNEEIARRSANGGWESVNVQPPSATISERGVYVGFNDDLSVGFLDYNGAPLAEGAPGAYASGVYFDTLYSRAFGSGAYESLIRTTPPNRSPEEFGAPVVESINPYLVQYAGSSVGLGHELFAANAVLTSNAHEGGASENNLYDFSEGTTTLVNVLPNGQTEPNAMFGGSGLLDFLEKPNPPILKHVISDDGSRIFWTDLNTGDLYVRENDTAPQSPLEGEKCLISTDACTVLVAAAAHFWDATPDGSKVLYTKGGDLYEENLETAQVVDLAPQGEVKGVAGASEDLSYVYFVADAALAPGAQKQQCNEGEHEAMTLTLCNLYAAHLGEPTRFIGALSPADNWTRPESFYKTYGVWQGGLSDTEAEVTPDGTHLLFISREPLTGYYSRERNEVFLFDFQSGQLSCISCNPTGEAPPLGAGGRDSFYAAYLPASHLATRAPQWMTDDGDRMFFDSKQALVPQDTNDANDVYEWEADGSGTCASSPGCIYLLSDGGSREGSYLIGSSASGDDVFFTTRGKLVYEDENENIDVYDARVGAVNPPAAPQCTGTGCQGVPSAPPVFATPPSVTYNGVGDFRPTVSVPAKAKAKPRRRAEKVSKALKRCRKETRSKRAACERRVRGRHLTKAKRSPSSKRGNVKHSAGRGK